MTSSCKAIIIFVVARLKKVAIPKIVHSALYLVASYNSENTKVVTTMTVAAGSRIEL